MPKRTVDSTEEATNLTMDAKMDMIVTYLHRMDRRDHWRTVGSTIKGLLSITSLLLVLGSGVWFLLYGDQFVEDITNQVIEQSMGGIPTMDSIR